LLLYRATTSPREPQRAGITNAAWLCLAAVFIAAPPTWNVARPLPAVPARIRALYKPGMINVVEFEDLQCPHCRRLHPLLQKLIKSYPGKVNFVRKHAPLPQHEYAEDAARAVICADQLAGRGNEMADRLVEVELDPQVGPRTAAAMGLDAQQFKDCLTAPSTQAHLDEDDALIRAVGFEGLPTTYVGPERFIGTRNENETAWRDAFDRAAQGDGSTGIPGPVFSALVLLVACAILFKGRTAQNSTAQNN
jgi:protein-disulfide isomerase